MVRLRETDPLERRPSDARLMMIAAVMNGALFAAALSILSLVYESNDDAIMMQIASGLMTGAPSEKLVFSNVLIGQALKHLYQWTDRFNWYTLYLIAVHIATMTGLLYAYLRVRPSRNAALLYIILFAQFEIALLLRLQFTSTAVMAAAVGFLLCAARTTPASGPSRLTSIYGGALIVLAAAIRPECLVYSAMLMSPLLILEFYRGHDWKKVFPLAAALTLAIAAVGYNGRAYRADPQWRAYVDYNSARGLVHDLPIVEYDENTQFFFDRIGWNYTDWAMFGSWFFADTNLFSGPKLQSLLDRFQGGSYSRPAPMKYLDECLKPLAVFSMLMYANGLLAVFLCRGERVRSLLIGGLQCLLVEGLLIGLAVYAKLVPRVVLPAYFASSATMLFVSLEAADRRRSVIVSRPTSRRARILFAAGVSAFCAFYGWATYAVTADHLARNDGSRRDHEVFRLFVKTELDRCVARDPQALFLNWWPKFPIQWSSPFDNFREFARLATIDLNWTIGSPHFDALLARYGVADLYRAAFENPHVVICTAPAYLEPLAQFVSEHYGRTITLKSKETFLIDGEFVPVNYRFNLFQLSSSTFAAIPSPSASGRTALVSTASSRR